MRTLTLLLAFLTVFLAAGAAYAQPLALPAFPDPVVSIDAAVDQNQVYLLVGTKKADKAAPVNLHLVASSNDGLTWSAPVHIHNTGVPITPRTSRGNDARIAAKNGKLIIVWTMPGHGAMASGSLAATISTDKGNTWSQPKVIVQTSPEKADEHGSRFPAVTVTDNAFHVIWIDARIKDRALCYTTAPLDGAVWQKPRTLDPKICACCWNTLRAAPDGSLYALYRDVDPSDMGLLTSLDNGLTWTRAAAPGNFNWNIDTCPHTGGDIAICPAKNGSKALFSTAWTGKENITGGYLMASFDNAKSWSNPLLLNDPRAKDANAHHTALATDNDGNVCVAFDVPSTADGARTSAICAALAKQDNISALPKFIQPLSPAAAKATHPLVVTVDKGFLVLWTQQENNQPAKLEGKLITNRVSDTF